MSEENNSNNEPEWYLSKYPDKPGRIINGGWHRHKVARDEKTNKISKLEFYRYFPKGELENLLSFLNSGKFVFSENSPNGFGIQTALVGKIINAEGKPPIGNEHQYLIHFSRVAIHRKQPLLIRIYECLTNDLGQIKMEMTYQCPPRTVATSFRKHRGISGRKLKKKLKAIMECRKKVDKKFKRGKQQTFIDHSHYSKNNDDEIFY